MTCWALVLFMRASGLAVFLRNGSNPGQLALLKPKVSKVKFQKILIVFVLLTMNIMFSNFGIPVRAAGQVMVLNDQEILDDNGIYHVLGEVENTGETPVTSVNITAAGYDQSGNVLASSSTNADLTVILPREKSPFDIVLTSIDFEKDVYNYSLSITFSEANPVIRTLKILSNTKYTDSAGFIYVDGILTNTGTGIAANVRVIATFYDSKGFVVWVNEEYSEPHDLLSGAHASFEVLVPDYSVVPLVANYALTADSGTQPSAPESPYSSILLPLAIAAILIAVLLVVIVFSTKKGQKHGTSHFRGEESPNSLSWGEMDNV